MEQKKTVLIVEDEKNIVDIIRFNLQRTGYNTLEAYDGEAGLAMAREKKPDLILLDVMMPKMMGFDGTVQYMASLGAPMPMPVSSYSNERLCARARMASQSSST